MSSSNSQQRCRRRKKNEEKFKEKACSWFGCAVFWFFQWRARDASNTSQHQPTPSQSIANHQRTDQPTPSALTVPGTVRNFPGSRGAGARLGLNFHNHQHNHTETGAASGGDPAGNPGANPITQIQLAVWQNKQANGRRRTRMRTWCARFGGGFALNAFHGHTHTYTRSYAGNSGARKNAPKNQNSCCLQGYQRQRKSEKKRRKRERRAASIFGVFATSRRPNTTRPETNSHST